MSDARKPRTFSIPDDETRAQANAAPDETGKPRKPRALEPDAVIRTLPDDAAQRSHLPTTSPDALADSLTPPPPTPGKRRWLNLSTIFFTALGGLLSLGVGLWVDSLVRDLFARNDWLGWLAMTFTALLVFAAVAICVRELWGLRRMAKIDRLRDDGQKASDDNDMKLARQVSADLLSLYASRPDLARGRTALEKHRIEIIDGRDLIHLAERDLMKPLDDLARGMVMGSAKRVSVVTAVSPRAIVDIAFVLIENMRLIRQLAELYGGRPGTIGFWRLARTVVAHLAVTGSIAIGDGLVQQLVGHGLAAKLSSRLGEGIVNGMLTARIGIAAIDVCRPLPFSDQTRPGVKEFLSELVSLQKDGETEAPRSQA